jgi:hypothetical protein
VRQQVGTVITRASSENSQVWNGMIEPRETSSGHSFTRPAIQSGIVDIRTGKIGLFIQIEVASQNIFHERDNTTFSFIYRASTNSFAVGIDWTAA